MRNAYTLLGQSSKAERYPVKAALTAAVCSDFSPCTSHPRLRAVPAELTHCSFLSTHCLGRQSSRKVRRASEAAPPVDVEGTDVQNGSVHTGVPLLLLPFSVVSPFLILTHTFTSSFNIYG